MDATPPQPETHRAPSRALLSPARTVLLAVTLGLCGGYLDLVVMVVMKYCWNDLRYFWSGSDFPWSVPVAHAFLLAIAGAFVALFNRALPRRPITLRAGGLAVRDAGDLVGLAAGAPVRCWHAALGRRAGAADQHGGRRLGPAAAAGAVRLGGALGPVDRPGGPLVRSPSGPRVSRDDGFAGAPTVVPATSCSSSGTRSAPPV